MLRYLTQYVECTLVSWLTSLGRFMLLHDDYHALVPRMEGLLAELDRLQLPLIAVHVDLALRRLEETLAGSDIAELSKNL